MLLAKLTCVPKAVPVSALPGRNFDEYKHHQSNEERKETKSVIPLPGYLW